MGLGRQMVARRFDELSDRMAEVMDWSHKTHALAERTAQPEEVRAAVQELERHALIMHNLCVALKEKWADAPAFRSN